MPPHADDGSSRPACKSRSHDLADGYIVLPGGLGIPEEMAEVAMWIDP